MSEKPEKKKTPKNKKSVRLNSDNDHLMRLCVEAAKGCRWFDNLKSVSREIIEIGLRCKENGKVVEQTFPSEEFGQLHVTIGIESSRRFPMPPSKELLFFLDEQDALDLVSVTSESPYISLKAPSETASELEKKALAIFLPFFTPNMKEGIDPVPVSTLIMSVSAYKKASMLLRDTKEVLDEVKTKISSEKNFTEKTGGKISYSCNDWIIYAATNPGGMKYVNRASFVSRFGEDVAEMFDVVYEKPMFRVETDVEKRRRLDLLMDFSKGERGSRRGFYRPDFVALDQGNIENGMDAMMKDIREEVESR